MVTWNPLSLWELSQISTTLVILQSLVQEHARRSRDRDQSEVEVGFCDPCNREIPSSSDVIFWKSLGYILVPRSSTTRPSAKFGRSGLNESVEDLWNIWVFPKIGVSPKWMVYNGTPY